MGMGALLMAFGVMGAVVGVIALTQDTTVGGVIIGAGFALFISGAVIKEITNKIEDVAELLRGIKDKLPSEKKPKCETKEKPKAVFVTENKDKQGAK